ncbi:MAG: glutamine amidotransferase, partial [Planctomycetota bacterium]
TPGDGAIAIIDGTGQGRTAPLVQTLRSAGIDVRSLAPEALPTSLLGLQAYDLIMLDNVPQEALPRTTHRMLAEYVETLGGGLVMIGGPDSFGAGGWNGTDLEDVLPVELDLPEQIITPSAAIAFVIDSSGSMQRAVLGGSRSQQLIANEATALAIETLDKTDLVLVLAFDNATREVVPLARNSDPERSAATVRAISPGGGTNLYPALDRAVTALAEADANVKHVIVLSDGQSQGDPEMGYTIANTASTAGITVSTIAVGDDADSTALAGIALRGGGQFYHVFDPNTLPRIFIKEIRVVRQPLIAKGLFRPIVLTSGSPLTADMPRDYPPLGGYVRTQPREDPKITYALGATEDEPLLAHWFVGRGQVAAFTSDASTWARQWLNWPGYARMWTQIARTIARPAMGRDYELTTEIVGDELVMRLEAFDAAGRPIDLLTVPGSVFTPDEGEVGVRLAQVGPGTYEARAPATLRGNYVVTVSPRRGEELLAPAIGGASRAVGPEFRSLRSNATLLREIAETTGGRVLTFASTASDELFARDGVTVTRAAAPLWRSLLAWCFVIFLLDVGTRRVAWDRLLSRDLRAELSEHAADLVKGRADAAARMTDRLRKSGEGRRGPAPTPREPAGPVTPPPPRPARSAEPATQDDEAARLERMKALRARMLSELRDGSSGRQRPTKDTKASEPENEGSTADLLAAKRRARARYREDDQATD